MDAEAVRPLLRRLRDGLSEELRRDFSKEICRRLLKESFYQKAETLFAYMPKGSEADVAPLLRQALAEGKTVGLPRVTGPGNIDFFAVKDLEALSSGPFNLLEPGPGCGFLAPWEADLILTPGLGFSPDGGRLGYGGGYYDRYLPRTCTPWVVFPAYSLQEAAFTTRSHDVKIPYVMTELGLRAL